ncbi:hypothetical protein PGT21_018457 [Puccinia graminis f. sp. tritici]|uniref:Uncharacterized protein n=1 Tax=Puccinia graminis f. sp. tritici TaxID=56615 RepID=A0A5B0NYR5_PUCGR|nr:hypothetical protein PGT21_018457 [Puccinia graminis f. sp. tritici]KAA1115732.1 hypothetical protein PGTUg99_029419 [Puccinia graminis f. sp. tritici]
MSMNLFKISLSIAVAGTLTDMCVCPSKCAWCGKRMYHFPVPPYPCKQTCGEVDKRTNQECLLLRTKQSH